MGMFKKHVRVSNSSDPTRFFEEDFWIDTGAMYSYIPADKLEAIGVEPTATRRLILADGRTENRLFGYCDFTIAGIEGRNTCPLSSPRPDHCTFLERLLWKTSA